ncbi:Solute carrier family 40 protein [Aphelenchoides bicaudatus]|nr:Solute carrier family 40 protein [Aphelenchoides bicaudatus]
MNINLEDNFSSFARVKLRRRVGGCKTDLEPVEYLESEEEEEPHKSSPLDFICCWHLYLLNWLLAMAEKSSGVKRPFLLLYSGYAISCIGDRLWTFAIVFVLERLGGIRLVCINQFIDAISAMLLSGYLGNWLDRHDRKFGTLTVLAVNNISVAISALMLFICLSMGSFHSALYNLCIGMSIIFCAFSRCASEAEKLSFTKDWIVVLAKKEAGNTLSKKNAMLTVIDQTSSVIAPLITGYSLTFLGYQGACAFFVGVNLAFWVVERYLLTRVYEEVNELHDRERIRDSDPDLCEEIDILTEEKNVPLWRRLGKLLHAYFRQPVFPAAFGLTMLYMTVLGFDGLAISFGKAQKLPDNIIGWFRSAGSVLGIAGAASYAATERRLGVRSSGFIGLMLQQVFLYFCVLSIFLAGSPFNPQAYWRETTWDSWWTRFLGAFSSTPTTDQIGRNSTKVLTAGSSIDWATLTIDGHQLLSIFVFFMGLTLARLGLWMADLSITQIMQQTVPERERGTVFGVQTAFCQLFSLSKDLVVLTLPDPRTFGYLIMMSVAFVTAGFLHYCYFLWRTRANNPKTSRPSCSTTLSSASLPHKTSSQELRPLTKSEDQDEKAID